MDISFAEYILSVKEWLEERDFLDYMTMDEHPRLMLGRDLEYVSRFYSATIRDANSLDSHLIVGINSGGQALVPCVLPIPDLKTLMFGFNDQVVALNVGGNGIKFSHSLPYLFQSFRFLADTDTVLTFYELGVICLSLGGEELWGYDGGDVLTSYMFERDVLTLRFMEGSVVELDVQSGKILPTSL